MKKHSHKSSKGTYSVSKKELFKKNNVDKKKKIKLKRKNIINILKNIFVIFMTLALIFSLAAPSFF